jgi:hypothetical protein
MIGFLKRQAIGFGRMMLMYSMMGVMGWDDALYLIIASIIINLALAPKQQQPQPTAFKDIDFPQADEGTPQCVVFGDCWISDWTVLAVGNYRVTEIHAGGGKK